MSEQNNNQLSNFEIEALQFLSENLPDKTEVPLMMKIIDWFKANLPQPVYSVWVKAGQSPSVDGFYCLRHRIFDSNKEVFMSYEGQWFRGGKWAYSVQQDIENYEWLDEGKLSDNNNQLTEINQLIDDIDFEAMILEDTLHEEEGELITKIRGKLIELKKKLAPLNKLFYSLFKF